MILKEVLGKSVDFLKKKDVESARWDAEALLAHGLGWERVDLYMKTEYPLSQAEVEICRDLIKKRGQGIPTAYLVGYKEFYKSKFFVQPGVLIPRSDSEVLVEEVLRLVPQGSKSVVMDWGCGSGCLGLSLLSERPDMRLISVDQEEEPIRCTTYNAQAMGLSDRVKILSRGVESLSRDLIEEQWAEWPTVLIANPPYVDVDDLQTEASVKEHEPSKALFSGDRGLFHIKTWLALAMESFPELEHIVFEMGYDQAERIDEFLTELAPPYSWRVIKDLGGRDRVVSLSRLG